MLGLGLIWTILIRVPLILNAEDHLDSDLAVDGLTLLDAVNGHWRWHYPGTPYMGILPMLVSYPQALLWGSTPITLVSGGTVIWALVIASTFWLTWKVFGPAVAGWAMVPLVCSSLGTIWLSSRITGGHLLTLAWHTVALLGLHACLTHGGWRRAATLGIWCGLGLYLDAMFLFTLAGLVPAGTLAWLRGGRSRSGIAWAAVFLAGMLAGLVPRELGRWVDPYDAYPSQFAMTLERPAIREHARLLMLHCLPRLLAGSELHDFDRQLVQDGTLGDELHRFLSGGRSPSVLPRPKEWLSVLLVLGFALAVVRLVCDQAGRLEPARKAVERSALLSALLIVAAFLVNRNIFNSDNYRYLIFLLTPWALGFGLVMHDLARRGLTGRLASCLVAGVLAEAMTADTFHWYRNTRHYLDEQGYLARSPLLPWSELMIRSDRLRPGQSQPRWPGTYTIPPEVSHVFGGYWDVYRLAFRSGKRVVGIPFPMYPNRFPDWSRGLGPDQGRLLILRPRDESRRGSRPAAELAGERVVTLRSADGADWRPALMTVWKADGRDPAELDRLRVVVP
jgi:hypothetical protein